MASNLNSSYETLADTETWMHVSVLAGGYIAGTFIKNTVEGRLSIDVPDEAYGIAIVVGATYALDGDVQKFAAMGGGLHTLDALATRLGIKSQVQDLANGGA